MMMQKLSTAMGRYAVFLFFIAAIIGFLGAEYGVRYQNRFSRARYSTAEILRARALGHQLRQLNVQNDMLAAQTAERTVAMDQARQEQIYDRIHALQEFMGMLPRMGSGIDIALADNASPALSQNNPNVGIVHNTDLVGVINDLRSAGANPVALNGQTITPQTSITCNGPVIFINQNRVASPFHIQAIGSSARMVHAVNQPKAYLALLRRAGVQVHVQANAQVRMPAAAQSAL